MKIYSHFFFNTIPFYLIVLLPAFLVSGPFLADTSITLCAIIFLINSYKNNLSIYYKNYFFYIFISFFIIINFSSLLSSNQIFSLKTSVPYLRFGIFALSVFYIVSTNEKIIKYLFYSWLLVFILLEIDGIYQYINKINLFNYNLIQNRVSSFFGDELIMGSFISRNIPLFLFLFFVCIKKNFIDKKICFIFYIVFTLLPFLVFLSGERSAIFYVILGLIYILILNFEKKIVLSFLVSLVLIISGIFFFDARFSDRIINTTKQQLTFNINENKNKIRFFSVSHEEHYESALRIFKDHIFFGAGPKSFRIKCSKKKYLVSNTSCVSHPHNTYIQLLSETGIIGFFFIFCLFLGICMFSLKIFIKKYFLKNKVNSLEICILASFLITLWPIIPSGNFFTNWLNVVYYLPVGFFLWIKSNDEKPKII